MTWSSADIPDQQGRVCIVTGSNTGLGLSNARMLAEKGATVIMACRNIDKANAAAQSIRATSPFHTRSRSSIPAISFVREASTARL